MIVLVCGLARCGTSLTMQMLQAGGMRCAGRAPAFEDFRAFAGGYSDSWMREQAGGAVKVLDPQLISRRQLAALPAIAIWLGAAMPRCSS